RPPPTAPLFPYTTLFRSTRRGGNDHDDGRKVLWTLAAPRIRIALRSSPRVVLDRDPGWKRHRLLSKPPDLEHVRGRLVEHDIALDRKSTRLNSSHVSISY